MTEPMLLTIRETAEKARTELPGLSEGLLREMVKDGRIPVTRAGNRALVFWPNVVKAIENGDVFERPDATPRPRYGAGSRGGRRR